MVECLLAKEDVASSSLVSRSIKKSPSKGSFLLHFSLIEISENLVIFYPKGTIRGLFEKFVDFTRDNGIPKSILLLGLRIRKHSIVG